MSPHVASRYRERIASNVLEGRHTLITNYGLSRFTVAGVGLLNTVQGSLSADANPERRLTTGLLAALRAGAATAGDTFSCAGFPHMLYVK